MIGTIAVIGQGYVGLPLALAFAKKYPVIGYDTNDDRVSQLLLGNDYTQEVDSKILIEALEVGKNTPFTAGLRLSSDAQSLKKCGIYIVTVPTPIDEFNAPDLSYLLSATKTIASVMAKGAIVVFESTVYPGCTEEDCVPVLERYSGLKFNVDFFVGYSPERINPGDKVNTLENVIKITSGSTPEVAQRIDLLYKKIITAGTYLAPSIKVAEAAKAIENAQRDVNISFVNELALIFDRVGIDTHDVLEAASTKYNFLKFQPGLVGGHCISVDPYYLAHKASQLGYHPEVILSGRRVNDRMAQFVASKVIKLMLKKDMVLKEAKVLILGITFKENCPDVRNSKVVDIYDELVDFGASPVIYDPWVNRFDVLKKYPHISMLDKLDGQYDAIILAVAHKQFITMNIEALRKNISVIFDCKAVLDKKMLDGRL